MSVHKVTPINDASCTPPVVLARVFEVLEDITDVVVIFKRKDGGYSIRRSPMQWEDCAAMESLLSADTQWLLRENCKYSDQRGNEVG